MGVRTVALLASVAFVCSSTSAHAQAKPPAPTRKPAPAAPAPRKVEVPPPVAAKPPPPAPVDVHFKTRYTTGDQVTESTTYIQGDRERRYELGDMILLKQRDQKRTVQISLAANTYLFSPQGVARHVPHRPLLPRAIRQRRRNRPGVVMIATTIVDTGERKEAFGQQARHVKTMVDRQPNTERLRPVHAADRDRLPGTSTCRKRCRRRPKWAQTAPRGAAGCADEVQTTAQRRSGRAWLSDQLPAIPRSSNWKQRQQAGRRGDGGHRVLR